MENRSIKARGIFQKDGKVLLCRTVGQDYYFFPGGSVIGEEGLEETLRREIKEEFNSGIKNINPLCVIENKAEGYLEVITMFSADFIDPEVYNTDQFKLNEKFNIEAEWILLDDIKSKKVKIFPEYDYLSLL